MSQNKLRRLPIGSRTSSDSKRDKIKDFITFLSFPPEYKHCGFVLKEGVVNTDFRKRWLMFEGDELSYYIKENLRDKKGVIPLKKIKNVYQLNSSYKGKDNVFALVLENRTFLIQAPTPTDAKLWVEAIRKMKEFFESKNLMYYIDSAIDVFDDPSYDLGEEITTPSPADLNPILIPPSTMTSSSDRFMSQIRGRVSNAKFVGAIGQTRSKSFQDTKDRPSSTPKLDFYDKDDEEFDEDDTTQSELEKCGFHNLEKKEKQYEQVEIANEFKDISVVELFQEMKTSVKFYNMCFKGSELVDWLMVFKDWTRQTCVEFGAHLLWQRVIEPISSNQNKRIFLDNDTIYRFSFGGTPSFSTDKGMDGSTEVIVINAGGQFFHTNEKTLLSISNTYFTTLLSQEPQEDGSYFIDRNCSIFEDILDYLRDGEIFIPTDKREIFKLKREALFYQLPYIVEMCDKALEKTVL